MTYQIIEATPESKTGVSFRGGPQELWRAHDPAVILDGPAETGKTFAALHKLDALCWKYPGTQAAIVRKTHKSCVGSACQTYQRKVANMKTIDVIGGVHPERYQYPNGSTIWIGGMDNPDKVLSSERDFIYINQAEELEEADFEVLTTRASGRAGNAPYAQVFGDCNPSGPTHWIIKKANSGDLRLIKSCHKDNPTLYDDAGNITEQGRRSIAILQSLTGLRRKRLYEGLWVQAEGVIYEGFDSSVHVINRFDIPSDWRRFRVVDFGYTNPFVCGWWAIDHDGRIYLYREIYHTRRTVRKHSEQINALSQGENIDATICDHDAEDRATLEENGIITTAADKAVSTGIEEVQERLKVQADGKPRLYILRDSLVETDVSLTERHLPTCTEEEFAGYVWNDKARKEEPVKENDHGMDMTRYSAMYAKPDNAPLFGFA